MTTLTIDGRKVAVRPEATVLEAARGAGIHIPTLCYHEALAPTGACRLCIVEVTQDGRTKTAASCVTPAEEGMAVVTNSEKILSMRRTIVELLLARCPKVPVIKELAKQMGVGKPRFRSEEEDCFLCGLCVRACEEIVGVGAIGFTARGTESDVIPPFKEVSMTCIGCGTCTTICPARTFQLEEVNPVGSKHRFREEYLKEPCKICGSYYPTAENL
ncbi:MAG: 2Fe-2S iron-sulfur cluster-binding protein [bacterium]